MRRAAAAPALAFCLLLGWGSGAAADEPTVGAVGTKENAKTQRRGDAEPPPTVEGWGLGASSPPHLEERSDEGSPEVSSQAPSTSAADRSTGPSAAVTDAAPAIPVPEVPRLALGLYPGVEVPLGVPNVVSWRLNGYLSLAVRDRFSVFAGYGQDWGAAADSELYTLGWGGVRPVPAGLPQRGFHGKFIRYRRWTHDEHGLHYGLSLGTESGFGPFGFAVEAGAARSDRNHWLLVAQLSLKVALPILIPLAE